MKAKIETPDFSSAAVCRMLHFRLFRYQKLQICE